ncbi:MAG TPA: PHP domain-containing protein [Thermodesulfobacteriota bacterium]|nr:PHP domain-containing protein [Thermodesulfobacteriota bacterium]HNU72856.1 PHP domain-containing protein [Thermodesulfobacteriota bacterium]HOC38823.1 PHP domain-containing protein [Thermodesulfobacteriota bacterium]
MKDEQVIDLHVHTSASDGTCSPSEVVVLAKKEGLKAIAITDHDTVEGNEEAFHAGSACGVEVISGVEISVEWNKCPVHVLGYFVEWEDGRLERELQKLVQYREERNPQIIEKLNRLGLVISYDEVKRKAGNGIVGRPHIAQVLIEKGYVRDSDEAFSEYLQSGAAAYVEKKRLSPREGIQLIKDAGGLAVMAHPFTITAVEEKNVEDVILLFREYGIEGLEVFYSMHTRTQIQALEGLAKRHSLLITGGSDFHGKLKKNIRLGKGFGNLRISHSLLDAMKNQARASRAQRAAELGALNTSQQSKQT